MRMLRCIGLMGLACALSVAPITAQDTAQSVPNLTTPYKVTTGDYAAIVLSEVLKLDASINASASPLVMFTPKENLIDVELFGSQRTVEGARKTLKAAWTFIDKTYLPYIKKRMSLTLTNQNFRISYFHHSNLNGSNQPLLTWYKGTLVVPSGSK